MDALKEALEQLGIDLTVEVIEQTSDSCNQVICRAGHPFAGYSIRDLLKMWEYTTGQKFRETRVE